MTGGYSGEYIKSTEIINVSDGKSRKAGNLNVARSWHGMGIANIDQKSKLIAFGGYNGSCLNSVEEWDNENETWKMSTLKLSEAKAHFGTCQLPSF